MNLSFRKLTMIAGSALLSAGCVLVAFTPGCGSGDDNSGPVASTDGGLDGTAPDSGNATAPDGTVADGAKPAADDGGNGHDGTVAGDAGPDGEVMSASDAGHDGATPADAGLDAGHDAAEPHDSGGVTDAGQAADVQVDAPPLVDFPHAVNAAYCARLRECCGVPVNQWRDAPDGGCTLQNDTYGGLGGIAGYTASLDSGTITYSPALAAACLQEVSQIGCGVFPASTQDMLITDCFAAMTGTLGVGRACTSSLECASGEVCAPLTDGGPGTACKPLAAEGAPCSDTFRSTDCSYLGHNSPALFCGPDSDGGDAGNTCDPVSPLGGYCTTNAACGENVCGSGYSCVNAAVFSDPGANPGTCAFYTIADAGN